MKSFLSLLILLMLASACATGPTDGARRTQIRDCPVGMVLICESTRDQEPSSGGDEEIPEYDRCRCENIM